MTQLVLDLTRATVARTLSAFLWLGPRLVVGVLMGVSLGLLLCLTGALAVAHAGVPVLHSGDSADAARSRSARYAAVPRGAIELHTLRELAGPLPPFTARNAPLRTCAEDRFPPADRTAEALRVTIRDVVHAEAMEIGERLLHLIPCQAPGADRHDLALAWFRYGHVLALERRAEAAERAFAQAVVFDPALDWDPNLAPDGTGAFTRARAAVHGAEPARLTVTPRPAVVRIDGVMVPRGQEADPLLPGWHVVELGSTHDVLMAYAIELEAGADEALVLPALVEDTDLHTILGGDPFLAVVVDRALPTEGPIWAVDGRAVYLRAQPGAPWELAERP